MQTYCDCVYNFDAASLKKLRSEQKALQGKSLLSSLEQAEVCKISLHVHITCFEFIQVGAVPSKNTPSLHRELGDHKVMHGTLDLQ